MADDSSPSINAAHLTAAGGTTLALVDPLADIYQYLTTWPLHALTTGQAHSMAILTMAAIGGGGLAYFLRDKTPAVQPVAPAPPSAPAP